MVGSVDALGVTDRTDDTWQPVGKQRRVADRGILYTSSSGIWQSVWMEPVARQGFVERLDMTPDIDTSTLRLTVATGGGSHGLTVRAVVRAAGHRVSTTAAPRTEPSGCGCRGNSCGHPAVHSCTTCA